MWSKWPGEALGELCCELPSLEGMTDLILDREDGRAGCDRQWKSLSAFFCFSLHGICLLLQLTCSSAASPSHPAVPGVGTLISLQAGWLHGVQFGATQGVSKPCAFEVL